jgi:hypothetical protein
LSWVAHKNQFPGRRRVSLSRAARLKSSLDPASLAEILAKIGVPDACFFLLPVRRHSGGAQVLRNAPE